MAAFFIIPLLWFIALAPAKMINVNYPGTLIA